MIITKNGKACAVLMPVSEDTDLEVVALSQNRSFWELYDQAFGPCRGGRLDES